MNIPLLHPQIKILFTNLQDLTSPNKNTLYRKKILKKKGENYKTDFFMDVLQNLLNCLNFVRPKEMKKALCF